MDKSPEFFYPDTKCGDHFLVDDLLDFPIEEGAAAVDGGTPASMSGAGTSCNSSSSAADTGGADDAVGGHFTEFCIPYEDLAELEWVSNFAEESFSAEDLQRLHLIQGITARTGDQTRSETPRTEVSIPGKARSKRSRCPGNWTSRLLTATAGPDSESGPGGEGRRCLHCATETTPQWRAGPMGPKTLCNACGVRYKSGRLVPEYRPASSPTFVLTKHSNSHRKVVELRRQKETVRAQQQRQEFLSRNTMFDEDHMIHHFRRMV